MHQTKTIEKTAISDGAISVKVRCCGDAKTDSVLTIMVGPNTTEDSIRKDVRDHHDQVSEKHEALQKAFAVVKGL